MAQASRLSSKALILFAALGACAAKADIVYTVTGTIAPVTGKTSLSGGTLGVDGGGYFGPAGGSIAGSAYRVTWTARNDCECIGAAGFPLLASSYPLPNPILDVTLTINSHTYDFGGNGYYGEFSIANATRNVQQTAYLDGGSMISTSVGIALTPRVGGEFQIVNNAGWGDEITSGTFLLAPVPVPAPVAGSGFSAMAIMLLSLVIPRLRRAVRRLP